MIERLVDWAIPALCGGILAWAATWWRMQKRRNTALEAGVQCLLRAEIIRNHDKYMQRKFCPIYARDALGNAYRAYHALQGNDVATDLYNEIMELPTEEQ